MKTAPAPESLPARPWWCARAVTLTVLLLLVALGGGLRRHTLTQVQPHVDEFTTLWAAEQILEHGVPRLPSGVLYTRGWLHTWITAGVLAGVNVRTAAPAAGPAADSGVLAPIFLAGRQPSLYFGLATILLIYWVGARGWKPGVGLAAALGLALLPEAIVWSSRARFYGLLQLLTLLLVWQTWEWLRARPHGPEERTARSEWPWALGWALLFALVLFTQEQALLLLPGLLLSMLLWRGRRWMVQPPRVVAFALVVAAAAARYALEIRGQPGYFETIQATRPYVGLVFDLRGAWRVYGPLFVAPERLPWTIGGLATIGLALWELGRRRSLRRLPPATQSTLFYAFNFLLPLAAIFLLVGTTWRDTRYLFFVLPLWLLLGAAGIVGLMEALVRPARNRGTWQVAAGIVAAGVLGGLLAQPAWVAANRQEEGFARVFAQVAALREAGDVVLSPQPPACALVLGHCDGYAIQRGYEEYVIERDGRLIDRWTGAPLINSTGLLSATVAAAPRTWFVSDGFRLATRFEADYLRFLLTHFDPVVDELGVSALRADGLRAEPLFDTPLPLATPLRFGPLELVLARRNSNFGPDSPLLVDLEWRAVAPISAQINTSVRLVNAAGEVVAQGDGPPARGIIPTTLFFDTPLPDTKTLSLPIALPNERYRIDVAAYEVGPSSPDGAPLITPLGEPQPVGWFLHATNHAPLTPPPGAWENGIVLLSAWHEPLTAAPGAPLEVSLGWLADRPTATPLTAFVHLLDESGAVVAQHDKEPEEGFFPTNRWSAETGPVYDTFRLALPDPLPADLRLVTGWYDAATGARVKTVEGAESIEIDLQAR